MGKGYVILGETTDYLTGKSITETHDEQARQRIARFLVEEKGYKKEEISSRVDLPVTVDGKTGTSRIDFVIRIEGRVFAIVAYGPGSLVSRQKPAVAAAYLIAEAMVPVVVVTNGIDAQVLDPRSGKVKGEGFAAIPSRQEAAEQIRTMEFSPVPESRKDKARRIIYAMDILTERECDDSCEFC
ncbi:MAG: type I restriction enzyme HsdR N-terminal domain-containing protein [Desulfosalsimonadaceae bacterium]